MNDQLHLGLQPIRAERAGDFANASSLTSLLPPFRSGAPSSTSAGVIRLSEATAGVVTFAILPEGGSLTDDWDLGVVLPAHYGEHMHH